MKIPPPPEKQCGCHECRFDRSKHVFGGADIYAHTSCQANWETYSVNPDKDTRERVREMMHWIVDRELDELDDWEALLKHYEYLSFSIKIIGHNKQSKCSCDPKDLVAQGCNCGGY